MAIVRFLLVLVCLAGVLGPVRAWGQGVFSGAGADSGSRRQGGYTRPPIDRSPSARDNAPRLEPGALLCPTEAALQLYQAAVIARSEGREATAVRGCRLVQQSMIVTVLERKSGRVHVKLPPPASPDSGWTDAALRG